MWKAFFIERNGKVCDSLGKESKEIGGVLEVHENILPYFWECKAGIPFAITQEAICWNCKARNVKLVQVI